MPPDLLLVEDDGALSGLLAELLTDEGYAVDQARDGQQGLHLGLTRRYDVIVLDRGLPAIEGVDLLRRLRRGGITTPTLILTARGTLADRVEGLDAGAEDYLVKPFDVEELLARLRALLRRHLADADVLSLPRGRFDAQARTVQPDGAGPATAERPAPVELSGREAALLEVLA